MASFEKFRQDTLRQIAATFGVPYKMIRGELDTASHYAEVVRRAQRREAIENADATRLLLSQWVSEIEPVLWCDSSGRVCAVGTAAEPMIFHPIRGIFVKALYRAFPLNVAEEYKWPNG